MHHVILWSFWHVFHWKQYKYKIFTFENELFPILAWYRNSVVQQSRVCLCCRTFHLTMLHTFSLGGKSGLQTRQSRTCTLLRQIHAVVTDGECALASCWNKQGCPSEMCWSPISWALAQPRPIQLLTSDFCDNSLDGSIPLYPRGHTVHEFQKQFEDLRTLFDLGSVHLRWPWAREVGGVSGCCWCFPSVW